MHPGEPHSRQRLLPRPDGAQREPVLSRPAGVRPGTEEPLGRDPGPWRHLLRPDRGRRAGVYDDRAYVFGTDDRRPKNTIADGGGMDVSPALNGAWALAAGTVPSTGASSTHPRRVCGPASSPPRRAGRGLEYSRSAGGTCVPRGDPEPARIERAVSSWLVIVQKSWASS